MEKNILIFGITNVGKSTVGEILAKRINYKFYDLDDEIKAYYQMTLEKFVNRGTRYERDKKRFDLMNQIMDKDENKVIAVTPLAYREFVKPLAERDDSFSFVLRDTAFNIFNRLVFSDENDVIYKDDDYKYEHYDYYMKEIKEDIIYYDECFADIYDFIYVDGDDPDTVVNRIITNYELQ